MALPCHSLTDSLHMPLLQSLALTLTLTLTQLKTHTKLEKKVVIRMSVMLRLIKLGPKADVWAKDQASIATFGLGLRAVKSGDCGL